MHCKAKNIKELNIHEVFSFTKLINTNYKDTGICLNKNLHLKILNYDENISILQLIILDKECVVRSHN